MGHTVFPMRWVIYDKLDQMKKLVKGLREPEKEIAEDLLNKVFQNISTITCANPLPNEIENNIIFTMLLQEKKKSAVDIDDLTIHLFSDMIAYKSNKSEHPHESDINRLLSARR
jgi:hypothetical protein